MPKTTTDKLLPLTLGEYAKERHLPVDYLTKTWGLKEVRRDGVTCIEQPYINLAGEVCAPRYRYGNKGKNKMSPPGAKLTLYGQKQLINVDSEQIVLVEGESDTQTLRYAAINVLGIPGTQTWDSCLANDPTIAQIFAGKTVIVIQEPPSLRERELGKDSPVKMFAKIKASLPLSNVVAVRLWEYAPRDEEGEPLYKDVNGLWTYYDGSIAKFMQALFIASRAAAKRDAAGSREIQSVLASDVEMALTKWLWYERIPVGDVTVFAGMPAKGKSTAAIDVVSRLTTGRDFPAGVEKQVPACEVAILASEDNPKTTTVPRLHAAQADVSKVRLITGTGDGKTEWEVALDRDLEHLKNFLYEHPDVKLIVMDPVTSYIGDVDPNKPKEVRPFLNKLKRFAEEMGVSLLLIMHLSKNPDVSALHRVGGAATWIEVPRSVWFFDVKRDEDGNETSTYVMVNGKLNIVADQRKKALDYTFESVDVEIQNTQQSMGTINWGEESSVTLEQQYGRSAGKGKPGMKPEKTEQAMAWLREYLADGRKFDVIEAGKAAGHADKTLRKAAERLEINIEREFPNKGKWGWSLPDDQLLGK